MVQVIRWIGYDSYFFRKLVKPDSLQLEFMADNLYPLPPSLKLCECVDLCDAYYLINTYLLSYFFLRNFLNIEIDHNKWYSIQPKISSYFRLFQLNDLASRTIYPSIFSYFKISLYTFNTFLSSSSGLPSFLEHSDELFLIKMCIKRYYCY